MEFIETPTFTRLVTALITDDEYRDLQAALTVNPERGDIIKGSGGVRKVRHAKDDRGKSGGVRVIYFWSKEKEHIYLLLIYPKSKKDNLSTQEVAILRDIAKEL